MSAAEFDAYTKGKTFYYGENNHPYGGEEYFANRRVRWSYLDGSCKDGAWYTQDAHICFVYEGLNEPQCWLFYDTPNGLVAHFQDKNSPTELYEVEATNKPLMCLGPEVGV